MKTTKSNKAQKANSIRVSSEIKKWLDETLKVANKKSAGRKIKLDDLMIVFKGKVTSEDIELLRERSQRGEDRKESMRQFYIETRGPISKDDFTDFMMTEGYFEFLSEYRLKCESHKKLVVAVAS